LNYGTLFKKELLFLVPRYDFNYSRVSKIFKIDPKSLKIWYERWKHDLEDENDFKKKQNEMRDFWEEKIKEYPHQTRSLFQGKFLKEYSWISYNDHEWFESHFPKPEETLFYRGKKGINQLTIRKIGANLI
jgi:Tn7-like transposition protein D